MGNFVGVINRIRQRDSKRRVNSTDNLSTKNLSSNKDAKIIDIEPNTTITEVTKKAWNNTSKRLLKSKMNTITLNNNNEQHSSIKISDDIEQLITMMKNHTVTDETTFDFNFNKLLTPQNSPPISTLSEFKFSFPKQQNNSIPEEEDDNVNIPPIKQQQQQQKSYQDRLNNRKILPLPKSRLLKSSSDNNIPLPLPLPLNLPQYHRTTTTTTTNDRDNNNKKKLKCSEQKEVVIVDNKRKERNWIDTSRNNSTVTAKTILVDSPPPPPPPPAPPSSIPLPLPLMAKLSITTTTTTTTKKKPTIKKNNDTAAVKKKKNKNKQKNEDIAPGGFLSSDITLFDNPISDDWICLFCQYDILFSSYEETNKKKNKKKTRRKKMEEEQDSS